VIYPITEMIKSKSTISIKKIYIKYLETVEILNFINLVFYKPRIFF